MNTKLFLILLLLVCIKGYTQSAFVPQNLGAAVNSEYDEINPVISPDGKTLYFVRVNHPQNKYGKFDSQDIWYSELVNGEWTLAKRVDDLNIGRYNAILSIVDDGKTVVLNGVFNKKGNAWKQRGLSLATKTTLGWMPPVKMRIKNLKRANDGEIGGACLSADGKTIFFSLSRFYNSSRSDIFFSEKKENGKWKKPKKVHALSSWGSDESPFLSTDNKTLYFASDDGQEHQFDIYKTKRATAEDDNWLAPKKLSDTINSSGWENHFKTTPKGSYAFFSSTNNATGGADIFQVKLFEENPFVLVSGIAMNDKTGQPMKKPFTIMVNGRQADSVYVNKDSATYRLKLPLGNRYKLYAGAANYIPKQTEIDASKAREFTKVKKNLLVTPIDYVHVEGIVIDRATGKPIVAGVDTRVLLNGAPSDSIHFDRNTGRYTLNIKHGERYQLTAAAPKYESSPSVLDLTSIDEYREMTLDLYLETEKMVLVSGLVLNKNTNSRFVPASKIQIVFNNAPVPIPNMDTLNSRYNISLQPGRVYSFTASAPNCVPVYETVDLTTIAKGSSITKDVALAPIEVGQAVRLNNIFFESGKAVLKKESFPELDRVYDFLSKNSSIKIEIGGHTDNVGNAAFNLTLSKSRAEAVANYIVKKGISKERLKSNGYGMTKPVTSNTTNAGKAQNRRVEFIILDK